MTERISAQQFKATVKPKANKYGAKKTFLDGVTFDSRRESEVYADLLIRHRAGEITDLVRQRQFNIVVNGDLIGRYTADFSFNDLVAQRYRVLDVKGVVTREFKRTKKLIKALYNIDIEVIK